jgi:hypothetical protein
VTRDGLPALIERKRHEGVGIDAKLLMLMHL